MSTDTLILDARTSDLNFRFKQDSYKSRRSQLVRPYVCLLIDENKLTRPLVKNGLVGFESVQEIMDELEARKQKKYVYVVEFSDGNGYRLEKIFSKIEDAEDYILNKDSYREIFYGINVNDALYANVSYNDYRLREIELS